MKRILLTGAAGFIGHYVLYKLLDLGTGAVHVTVLDRLDHSGNLNRLSEMGMPHPNMRFVFHDLRAPINDQLAEQLGPFEHILHLAAATHVDRSITDPMAFVLDNVVATCNLLNYAVARRPHRFIYFSTDEVFGPAPPGVAYKEDDRYRSGNPYAATKAGAEELAIAYHNTYQLPVIVTHTMNVLGVRQNPEKFLPSTIGKVRDGQTVTIHADKTCTKPGSRFYIDGEDVAEAIGFLLDAGTPGEKYNIVGSEEIDNRDLALRIAEAVGRELRYEMVDFHSSRPGHDLRYALDGGKMKRLGWSPKPLDIKRIVDHYLSHPQWLPAPKAVAVTEDKQIQRWGTA